MPGGIKKIEGSVLEEIYGAETIDLDCVLLEIYLPHVSVTIGDFGQLKLL